MSLEIESINEPILLPSGISIPYIPIIAFKKIRQPRRTFKTQEEREEGMKSYRNQYYKDYVKDKSALNFL